MNSYSIMTHNISFLLYRYLKLILLEAYTQLKFVYLYVAKGKYIDVHIFMHYTVSGDM